jgi:phage replication O-like protein O
MATTGNPQTEDGYTRIANELLEAIIRFDFSKRELNVLLLIIRKTYGFGKKVDDMTLTQIANATGINLANVSRCVADLANMNVLLKQQGRYGFILGINKDYGQWKVLPKRQGIAETASEPCRKSNLALPKEQTQKKLSKETIKMDGQNTLTTFLGACKAANEKPIPDTDSIFVYADKVGLSNEMLAVCWKEFKAVYLPTQKKQKDWRAHFRNAVRRNWYKLWFIKDGEAVHWTTAGEQARRDAA